MDYSQLGNKRNIRKQSPHATRVRNKVGLLILRLTLGAILIAGFAVFGAGIGLYFGILNDAPVLNFDLAMPEYQSSVIVCAQTGEELVRLHAGQNHASVSLDQIPLHVQHAFIAIEDERFFEHNGVDIRGMGRAAYRLIESGGARTEGASTITQQLIKNMLGHFESDFITKLQEQYLAIGLERHLTESLGCNILAKNTILEAYLNIINLGRTNQGVQAAAWFYYGVDVWDLTIVQGATIASITQNPRRLAPDVRQEANWVRTQLVLENMLRLEFITEEEFYEAINSNVYDTLFRTEGGDTRPLISQFDCFTNALIDALRDELMAINGWTASVASNFIHRGGLRIYSTQNHDKQAIVDRVFLDESYWPSRDFSIDIELSFTTYNAVTNQTRHHHVIRPVLTLADVDPMVESLINERISPQEIIEDKTVLLTPQPQAAFVLMDHHNGHVLAIRGIRGETGVNRAFNRASQAERSPGSQMKPIATFGPAFDLGTLQPASTIDDIPLNYVCPWSGGRWNPGNWWGSGYEGFSTARRGVYRSMNVVSARATIDYVGIDAMFAYLRNMGISTLVPGQDGPAVTLGGMHRGVRLVELAGAYGMVANGGMFNRPVFFSQVVDSRGNVIIDNTPNPTQVLRDTAAYLLLDTMRDTMRRAGSGATGGTINWRNNQQLSRDIPIAGKTGTSQRNRDLGFSGSTPYFTASVWMGNDNNSPMNPNTRSEHMDAWRSIMQEIHTDLPARQFERPSRIISVAVCRDSGLLPTDLCNHDPRGSRVHSDLFDERFRPTESCDIHQEKTFCDHGYLPGHHCPPWTITTRVGIVRRVPADPGASVRGREVEFPQAVLDEIVCTYLHDGSPPPGEYPEMPFPGEDDSNTTHEAPTILIPGQPIEPGTHLPIPTDPPDDPVYDYEPDDDLWLPPPHVEEEEDDMEEIPL